MGEVDNFVPIILKLLKQIDDKKDVFLDFPLPGVAVIVKQALQDMHARETALSDALINAAPVRNSFTYFYSFDNRYLFRLTSRLMPSKRKTLLKTHSTSS